MNLGQRVEGEQLLSLADPFSGSLLAHGSDLPDEWHQLAQVDTRVQLAVVINALEHVLHFQGRQLEAVEHLILFTGFFFEFVKGCTQSRHIKITWPATEVEMGNVTRFLVVVPLYHFKKELLKSAIEL